MTTVGRVFSGAGLGVLCAFLGFPAMYSFQPWSKGYGALFVVLAWMLPILTVFAGPGALLLSWIHTLQMERWACRALTRNEIRKLGVLLGIPLGIANLILTFAVVAVLSGAQLREFAVSPQMLPWLIPAVAGGAGLGWGVTLGLTPGRAARVRTPARPRRMRALRRDGPPFFDNRASRPIRRVG